jgi:two-component system, OmpR family, phosphate regulon response regulator PhoB
VRGIVCEFPSFAILDRAIAEGKQEQEMDLPCCEAVTDGEWLVVTVTVGDESTAVAGRAEDRGHGIRLTFTERDWQRLREFSEDGGPPSLPPVIPASLPHPVQAAPGTRVLIVDDDLSLQTILGTMLEASGISAVRAGSAEEAYDVMAMTPVDLLVLDWSLPGMSGLDLCKKLRGEPRFGSMPILFLTSHSSGDDLVTAFDAGADDFVAKPFRAPELKARVLGLLRRTRASSTPPS